jgi:hypothetical protein
MTHGRGGDWCALRLPPLAAVLLAAFVAAQEKRDVPRFSSKVDLVTVDAVVLDRQGRPVRGLTAEDFTLLEDGKPQVVASFEAFDLGAAAALPVPKAPPGSVATNVRSARAAARSFVLLVDDLSLAPTRQEVVRTALARFLGDGVREGDELIFATTSGDAWWTARMPEGREDLLALAARVRGRNLAETAPDAISEWEGLSDQPIRGKGRQRGGRRPGRSSRQSGRPAGAAPHGRPRVDDRARRSALLPTADLRPRLYPADAVPRHGAIASRARRPAPAQPNPGHASGGGPGGVRADR